ncbi:MAG: Xaa-Pro peptidase family protein [Muribaculaceae bacterium]|nr:Xaa-Pro peptidase family protein [Muribaculaceae bacterium]
MLLPPDELSLRISRLQSLMADKSLQAILVNDLTNLYYLTGRVYLGYAYIPAEGSPIFFVKRPVELDGELVAYIRKPEEIPSALEKLGIKTPAHIGLEMGTTAYDTIIRLQKLFPNAVTADASPLLRQCRSVKTPYEIKMLEISGKHHTMVYRRIPSLFVPGMSDIELQIEIERLSRREGCLGQFRISGDTMELFMGNVIAGDNADAPSPYDFAMGGAGVDPSLPVGANGTLLRQGMTVMVDVNGNYTGYMTDMTRTFTVGHIPEIAVKAHETSIRIHRELCKLGRPGTEAKALYQHAMAIVEEAGLAQYYMGHRQHAGFIGHGIGIEVNELPVIAPRSRDIIAENNVIALEPKFVIPQVGAVGIENTYVVTAESWRCITNAPEELIDLEG